MPMPQTLRIFYAIVILGVVFFAGVISGRIFGWFQPYVTLSITNHSGQELKALNLSVKTGQQKGVTELRLPKNGETIQVRFYVAGEGGYSLQAVLANNKSLESKMNYIESGYKVTAAIKNNSISTEYESRGI